MPRLRSWFNFRAVAFLTSLIFFVVAGITTLPVPALAATASPAYTCGSYGGSAYGNGCDTAVSSSTSDSSTNSSSSSAPSTPSSTDTGNSSASSDNSSSNNGADSIATTAKRSTVHWVWFGISFLALLVGLGLFFLLAKRRRDSSEIPPQPPITPN